MAMRNDANAMCKADLENFDSALDGQGYLCLGDLEMGDSPIRFYYFSGASDLPVDGENVLEATAMEFGRFLKAPVDFATLANLPSFAAVATTGSYSDLSGVPTIPAAQVQTDWNATTGLGVLLNKPSIPAAQVQTDWNASTGIGKLLNKPTLSTVATSGNYGDLSGIPTRSFNNTPSVSIQTVAAAANGSQLSASKDAFVSYSVTIGTTVSLAGNSSGYVVLEVCPTNSATAGDWVEVGRVPSGQSGTLVVGLSLSQTGGGAVSGIVPTGYFRRLRSVNVSGTPTYTFNSGQEVLI